MSDFNTVPAAAHRLELVGRERLVVSGVEMLCGMLEELEAQ